MAQTKSSATKPEENKATETSAKDATNANKTTTKSAAGKTTTKTAATKSTAKSAASTAAKKPASKSAAKSTTKSAAKTATKSTAKKTSAAEPSVNMYVEFNGVQVSQEEIINNIKAAYKAEGGTEDIKTLDVYVLPQNDEAYYVVNGKLEGKMIKVYFC